MFCHLLTAIIKGLIQHCMQFASKDNNMLCHNFIIKSQSRSKEINFSFWFFVKKNIQSKKSNVIALYILIMW